MILIANLLSQTRSTVIFNKSNSKAKVIFITGGVVSSLGKGLTAASLATNFNQEV